MANKCSQTIGRGYALLRKAILVSTVSLFLASPGKCQDMPIPIKIQSALLVKILKFNPKFADKETLNMLIVYTINTKSYKDELVGYLSEHMGLDAAKPTEIDESIKNYDLVYFMPGTQSKAVLCKTHKVLSVTGISEFAEDGTISLAFGIQNDKPKIYINLTSLKQEEHNFSSDLLRIATIYK